MSLVEKSGAGEKPFPTAGCGFLVGQLLDEFVSLERRFIQRD